MDALVSLSFEALLAITLIVFLGGLIKGFLGFGMPLFATPLLALFMPLLSVIPMMAVPVLASNIYQAKFSRKSLEYIKRFWPLGIGQIIGVSIGVQVLVSARFRRAQNLSWPHRSDQYHFADDQMETQIPPEQEVDQWTNWWRGGRCCWGHHLLRWAAVGSLLIVTEHLKKDDFVKAIALLYLGGFPSHVRRLGYTRIIQLDTTDRLIRDLLAYADWNLAW